MNIFSSHPTICNLRGWKCVVKWLEINLRINVSHIPATHTQIKIEKVKCGWRIQWLG